MGRSPASDRAQRIRRLLAGVPLYSEELGLDLGNRSDWFPWFLSASLFAKPIAARTAVRTASLLLRSSVRVPRDVERIGWDGLVQLLDQGGYTRYDFSTADKLLEMARYLGGSDLLPTLANEPSYAKVEDQLTRIRGVGPKTVEIFLRELRGRWKASPPGSEAARRAARRLNIAPADLSLSPPLRRRVESGLVRLWIEYCKPRRWQTCPIRDDCGCRPHRERNRHSPGAARGRRTTPNPSPRR